jgi:hypothetical protein
MIACNVTKASAATCAQMQGRVVQSFTKATEASALVDNPVMFSCAGAQKHTKAVLHCMMEFSTEAY